MKLYTARIATFLLPTAISVAVAGPAVAAKVPTPGSRPAALESSSGATTIHGRLHVFYADDFDHRRASTLYFVEEQRSRKLYRVRLSHAPKKVGRSGTAVSLSGRIDGESLTLDAAGTQAFDAALESTTTQEATASEATAAQTRRAIVMVASFQDANAECMVDTIHHTLFGASNGASVDALYKDVSLGQLGFSGNVVGPYAVADTATGKCDLAGWASALDAKATASGIDLSQYQNKVYVLPSKSSCAVGVGSVGGSPGVAYVSRCGMPDAFAHELGHNLALNHASTPTDQYGDTSDIMGYSGLTMRGLNAPHLQQLGWRAASQVRTVTSSGTYDVAPLELAASQAVASQMLRIAKPDTGEEYYVSWRQPIGIDASLAASHQRLSVHRYANMGGRTFLMGTYADGGSFVDSTNGITITAVSHTSSYYTVQVQLGSTPPPPPPSCTRSAPTLTLTPSSQSGTAGASFTYNYTLANRDGTACAASTFSLTRSVPTGWGGSLSATSVTVSPGQSATGTLVLSSPASAAAGSWSAGVSANDAAVSGHSASGTVTAVLSAPPAPPADTQAPSAPTGTAATANRKKMTIAISWAASTDNVGVTGYEVFRDGVKIASTGGTSYVDSSVTDTATHGYSVKAYDAAGNRSATGNTANATLGSMRGR